MSDLAQLCRDADHIIIGSGPAGGAAALRLVAGGRRVLMLDAGQPATHTAPAPAPITISEFENTSPKLRDPRYVPLFEQYRSLLGATVENFSLWGMAALGGLSNAWGGGIAEYDAAEFGSDQHLPALQTSYATLSARLSIYGSKTDRLSGFYGRHTELQPYYTNNNALGKLLRDNDSVQLGHARYALGADCTTPYNAADDLTALQTHDNFTLLNGIALQRIEKALQGYRLRFGLQEVEIPAGKLILACGTLMTTKLILQALNARDISMRLCSSPSAGFAVWFPELSLRHMPDSQAIAPQASFVRHMEGCPYSMGNFFAPDIVDPSELISRMPISQPVARQLLRLLLPGLVLGNAFMHSDYSDHKLQLKTDGSFHIQGGYQPPYEAALRDLQKAFSKAMLRLRGITLPGSFAQTPPGSDIHYAATLPMRNNPGALQTSYEGEVTGLPGITLVDGSILPSLPAKAHTFTIMANADRIATSLLNQ